MGEVASKASHLADMVVLAIRSIFRSGPATWLFSEAHEDSFGSCGGIKVTFRSCHSLEDEEFFNDMYGSQNELESTASGLLLSDMEDFQENMDLAIYILLIAAFSLAFVTFCLLVQHSAELQK